MPTVAKRGRTRSVALVTTDRPVHERTLARTVRATARRLGTAAMWEVDRVMAMREEKDLSESKLRRKRANNNCCTAYVVRSTWYAMQSLLFR